MNSPNRHDLIRMLRALDKPADDDVLTWSSTGPVWAAGGSGGAGQLNIDWVTPHSDINPLTLTNQANSEQFLDNDSNRSIRKADLTDYTDVRLLARVITGSASANTPRIILEYHTSFSVTAGDYSDIGSSAVTCSLTNTGIIDSGWIALVAGAKADVFLAILQNGGDATADPQLSWVAAQFR